MLVNNYCTGNAKICHIILLILFTMLFFVIIQLQSLRSSILYWNNRSFRYHLYIQLESLYNNNVSTVEEAM